MLKQILQRLSTELQRRAARPPTCLGDHGFGGLQVAGIVGSNRPHQRKAGFKTVGSISARQAIEPGERREGLAGCHAIEGSHHRSRLAGRRMKPATSHCDHSLSIIRRKRLLKLPLGPSAKLQFVGITTSSRHPIKQRPSLGLHARPGGPFLRRLEKAVSIAGEDVVDDRAGIAEATGSDRLTSLIELPLPQPIRRQKKAAFLIRVASESFGDSRPLGPGCRPERPTRSSFPWSSGSERPPQQAADGQHESAPRPSRRPFHAEFAEISRATHL